MKKQIALICLCTFISVANLMAQVVPKEKSGKKSKAAGPPAMSGNPIFPGWYADP